MPGISVAPFTDKKAGSRCQNLGLNGNLLQQTHHIGPVDGPKALGCVQLGPGEAEKWVFLLEGTAANLLVGQICLFPVTGRDPKSKSCDRCDRHDPMMD